MFSVNSDRNSEKFGEEKIGCFRKEALTLREKKKHIQWKKGAGGGGYGDRLMFNE